MQEAVSQVLSLRAHEADGLSRMVVLSTAAHAVLLLAIWMLPSGWDMSQRPDNSNVMVIDLPAGEGPNTGGMTTMSNRPVQAVAPPEVRRAPVTPPAAKAPEMVAPDTTKASKPPTKQPDKPVDKSSSRKPTTGAQIAPGSAKVDTGQPAFGQFSGLSTGGGGTGGATTIGDFCCPDYIVAMNQRIRSNWNPNQGAFGQAVVRFIIRRDGMLTNVELERSSGNPVLDLEARRAVLITQQVGPLPAEFTRQNLTVLLTFDYKR
jgi:periplasmic protein TonB